VSRCEKGVALRNLVPLSKPLAVLWWRFPARIHAFEICFSGTVESTSVCGLAEAELAEDEPLREEVTRHTRHLCPYCLAIVFPQPVLM
jgi:hypothetical protein